ncbi:MAG: esterase/lipase family protein [Gammaproteobacteria bacterium]
MSRHLGWLAILPLAAALTACATPRMPDLSRLYEAHASTGDRAPVVLIPGMLGSRLARRDSGEELWPGSTRKLLTSRYLDLALRIDPATLEPLDDGLVPSGLFDAAVGQDFYGRVVRALQEVGAYQLSRPGQQVLQQKARLYVFTYDWRQDTVVTVRQLDAFIEQIRRDYGDPQLRVDVVAHSMGGLIARYYQRYGTDDVLDGDVFPVSGAGARKLRRMVLLGVPNQGTALAVHKFLHGYQVGLSRLPPEGVATMPGLFQFFPHPLVTWITTVAGRPLSRDVFEVDIWRRFEWSIFDPRVQRRMAQEPGVWPEPAVFSRWFEKRLERARRFAWSLMVPTDGVVLIEPLMFGGDCIPTPRHLVVEEVDGESVTRLTPEQILRPAPGVDYERLMYEPGDGSVTKSSLLGRQQLDPSVPRHEYSNVEISRAFFICEQHDALTGNINLIDNLLHYLLSSE